MDFSNKLETVTTDTTNNITILRLRVTGGWVVVVQDTKNTSSNITSSVFVPDAQWIWSPTSNANP